MPVKTTRYSAPRRYIPLYFVWVASVFVFTASSVSFLDFKLGGACLMLVCVALAGFQMESLLRAVRFFGPLWLGLLTVFGIHVISRWEGDPLIVVARTLEWATVLGTGCIVFALGYDRTQRARGEEILRWTGVIVAVSGLGQYLGILDPFFPPSSDFSQPMYGYFGNQNLVGGYCAIVLPLWLSRAFASRREFGHRTGAVFACGAVALAVVLSGSLACWIAATIGGLVQVFRKKMATRMLTIGGLVAILFLIAWFLARPALLSNAFLQSLGQEERGLGLRLWFWDGTARLIGEHPLKGVGPGNYPYAVPPFLGKALEIAPAHVHNEEDVLHPHNEVLAVLSETGLVGGLFCLWMLGRVIRRPQRNSGPLAAACILALSTPLFISAPHVLAICALIQPMRMRLSRVPGLASSLVRVVCMLLAIGTLHQVVWPRLLLGRAEQAYREGLPSAALFEASVTYAEVRPRAYESYGIARYEEGDIEGARRLFEAAAKEADSGRIHYALALTNLELGHGAEARSHLDVCAARWPLSAKVDALRDRLQNQTTCPGIAESKE